MDTTRDGRLIICLESNSKTLKIFYQDKLKKPEKKKEEKKD